MEDSVAIPQIYFRFNSDDLNISRMIANAEFFQTCDGAYVVLEIPEVPGITIPHDSRAKGHLYIETPDALVGMYQGRSKIFYVLETTFGWSVYFDLAYTPGWEWLKSFTQTNTEWKKDGF